MDTLKILIVDDTVASRRIITNAVSGISGTEVVGTTFIGSVVLSRIAAFKPDLVLLDISMSAMDGLETLKAVRSGYPGVDVVMISGIDRGNANLTMRALSLGALDFIAKPQGATTRESLAFLQKSLGAIVSLVKTRKYSRQSRNLLAPGAGGEHTATTPAFTDFFRIADVFTPRPRMESGLARRAGKIEAVGIGVSTGGPVALQKIIPQLSETLRVPILAVQHMPSAFTASLAERLDRDSNITVEEARNGMTVEAGTMYIARGGSHLVIRGGAGRPATLGIIDSEPVNSYRPSVDVLFRSMTSVYGGNILAVILTGMGRDGASGVAAIRRKGGYCIVQDEATSVVWGMPHAIVEAREADEILPADQIARRIMEITEQGV